MAKKNKKRGVGMGIGLVIGVAIGVPLWLMSDNIIWIAICIPIGFAIGASIEKSNKNKKDDSE